MKIEIAKIVNTIRISPFKEKDMKVTFTRGSSKPNEGVTVTAGRLWKALGDDDFKGCFPLGFYILSLKKPRAKKVEQVVFWTNRGGKTLYTSVWPENYPMPEVGSPVDMELEEIDGPFTAKDLGIE